MNILLTVQFCAHMIFVVAVAHSLHMCVCTRSGNNLLLREQSATLLHVLLTGNLGQH